MLKKPNHLGTLIDHQSAAKNALPETLSKMIERFTQATNEVRELLKDCLPEEILQTCQVVGIKEEQITLSVQSHTAANHLRYLQAEYVRLLKENSVSFSQLQHLRIIVTPERGVNTDNMLTNSSQTEKMVPSHSPQPHIKKGFSETTRQTIAHAANHVITDEALRKSLLKLAKTEK